MNADHSNRKGLDRRAFLLLIGGASAAVISGWVLVPPGECRLEKPSSLPHPFTPRLAQSYAVKPGGAGAWIVSLGPRTRTHCQVNDLGRYVLEEMDGHKTVEGLALTVMSRMSTPPADVEALTSSIALFLAELGQAGLLAAPFYANLCCAEVSP